MLREALARKIRDYSALWAERDQLRAKVEAHEQWLKQDSQYAENQRLRAELAEAREELSKTRTEILNLTTSKTIAEYERGETVTLESLLEEDRENERNEV